jgi:hypothetical protein
MLTACTFNVVLLFVGTIGANTKPSHKEHQANSLLGFLNNGQRPQERIVTQPTM